MSGVLGDVLGWFGVHVFGDPWVLLFLLLVPLVAWLLRRRRYTSVDGGSDRLFAGLPVSLRARLRFVPGLLLGLAVSLLVIALARPQQGRVETRTTTEGIDIQLVVDTSSSMTQSTLEDGPSNLEVVKEVVASFVKSRPDDRLGLTSFAAYPRTESPLTLDHQALLERLREVQCVRAQGPEDGTSIGVALGHAAVKLRDSKAKSKVVVLLTDGEENGQEITPAEAAALCAELGVKVYTIAAGRPMSVDLFGRAFEVPYDTTMLEQVAATTGGRCFRAKDKDALAQVYEQIDRLERTEIEDVGFTEYVDLYPKLLGPALVLLLLELLLSRGPWLEFSR
ncbi:MAG: VWA domain-containing protein [Planctomycetes bacterium]|nr:VWA domain-containing protein [Planctomycetota bacterium]